MPGPQPPPSPNPFISPLPRPTSTRLRSATIIPSLPQILSELVQNSLDAKSKSITCWLNLASGNESIRVQDDGSGIDEAGLRRVGERFMSSKDRTDDRTGPVGSYGFRGEALASIAALGLVEITSRTSDSRDAYTKIIKASKVLFEGRANRAISHEHGTSVIVKDVFHNIPVRQAALSASSATSTLAACRKVIETLALSRPGIKWVVWEERDVGTSISGMTGPKRVLSISGGKTSADVFRSIYGGALVERVQKVRVSSGNRRVDGFISLQGAISKTHQYIYVNHFPIERGDLHLAITKRFSASRFSVAMQDDLVDPEYSNHRRKSPRRLERYPIYALNIEIPSGDVDAAYEPRKRVLGYRDEDSIRDLLIAVVDEFLKRHGFTASLNARSPEPSPTKTSGTLRAGPAGLSPIARSPSRRAEHLHTPIGQDRPGCPPDKQRLGRSGQRSSSRLAALRSETLMQGRGESMREVQLASPPVPHKRPHREMDIAPSLVQATLPASATPGTNPKQSGWMSSGRKTIDKFGGKRHAWIDELVRDVDLGVLPFSPSTTPQPFASLTQSVADTRACTHSATSRTCTPHHRPGSSPHQPTLVDTASELTFTKDSLSNAQILSQIDRKFICCLIQNPVSRTLDEPLRTLALIDQHAADERVSVEAILQELCIGFLINSMEVTNRKEVKIVLTAYEAGILLRPGVMDVLERWGIRLSEPNMGESDYVQVGVLGVPAVLAVRLGRKEGTEMTRLVKLYLAVLDESLEEVNTVCRSLDEQGVSPSSARPAAAGFSERVGEVGWRKVLRWMPKEMIELANSKACRGAIMFGDRLDLDQCTRLVKQLARTELPFQCAHGRPSLVPLVALGGGGSGGGGERPQVGKRRIDWGAWKSRVGRGVMKG